MPGAGGTQGSPARGGNVRRTKGAQLPHPLLGTLRTLHRRHQTLRPQHRKTLDRNRRRTTPLHPRKLPRNLPRPLNPSSQPPRFRHPPKTQRHHHPNRLHQNLRHPNPSRHRSHAPSSRHRIHHPRPNLHRQINVRPNRRNPPRQPRPFHPSRLHPLRRPTPNLRLPQPNLEPQQPTVGATLVVAQARRRQKPPLRKAKGTRSGANAGDARSGVIPVPPPVPSIPQTTVIPANRRSRKPPSFPRTREPREKQITPFTLPFAQRRGRGAKRTQGMPGAESSPSPSPVPSFRRKPTLQRTERPSRGAVRRRCPLSLDGRGLG